MVNNKQPNKPKQQKNAVGTTQQAATTTTATSTETGTVTATTVTHKQKNPGNSKGTNNKSNTTTIDTKASTNSKAKSQQRSNSNANNNKPKTTQAPKNAQRNPYTQTAGKAHCQAPANNNLNDNGTTNIKNNTNNDIATAQPPKSTVEAPDSQGTKLAGSEQLIALSAPCAKCSKSPVSATTPSAHTSFPSILDSMVFTSKQYRKSKSYMGNARNAMSIQENGPAQTAKGGNTGPRPYYRSYSDRRSSFDRNFAERNKGFVPIVPPAKPVLSASNIAAVIADHKKFTIIERLGKGRTSYPIMQCGTLDVPDSSYHQQRSNRMDVYQIDDGFHSDGGTETPPPSPSSGSSIASTSDHGSLESVDTGGTQRLAVLSFEQVRKLHDVMDEKVAIHGRGNFPTLEVTLKDLVNSVRRKLEADVSAGGAGVIVKDIRLNGGAASHVLASEDQPYNDLDLIYAIELSSTRHFDRVKSAVLNTLLDLLPEGVCKRRIMPCALKEAYVGKMVKVNNNNDGDRWSLISLGNSPGHKNVELKFVDTMRRQFEFSVDSFQVVLDSLLLFYDCAALPISENFYPTVVGESVYGDFQEALYHLQKKLISTRQPEEIRGGGLLKYCNLLVRNYKPVDPPRIKTLERYMCSRFFIDFPDINTQTVKLEAYLRNHFWGVDEEPMQYQYLMHLREVVEMSTVCLMGHERRQTLLLIQSLAAQVLYKEQQKHQQEHYHQQQQQQQHQVVEQQQQQQTVTLMAAHHQHQHQQHAQQQPQTIYLQQAPPSPGQTTICCTMTAADQQSQQQAQSATATTTSVPQTIQIQAGPPGLIYANGVYYAPVIPTTICTCNSTWLST